MNNSSHRASHSLIIKSTFFSQEESFFTCPWIHKKYWFPSNPPVRNRQITNVVSVNLDHMVGKSLHHKIYGGGGGGGGDDN